MATVNCVIAVMLRAMSARGVFRALSDADEDDDDDEVDASGRVDGLFMPPPRLVRLRPQWPLMTGEDDDDEVDA
jgi:hypothetical protein